MLRLMFVFSVSGLAWARSGSNGSVSMDEAMKVAYDHFNSTFNFDLYSKYQHTLQHGARQPHAYVAYSYGSPRPHCDKNDASPTVVEQDLLGAGADYPGGITKRYPPDFSRKIVELASNNPTDGGALVKSVAMGVQATQMAMGLVQTIAASIIHIVPPLIPPPVWINMPLPCAPMITGHNCFGAVLYPITMADFLVADMTDKVMDGYIAGFPELYASKVGKTNDAMYKVCGSAYLTMHCSAIFPRCTMPNTRDEPIPVGGRVPLCLHLCILFLVLCPGFWIGDISGTCSFVSVPPMCMQAFFWNVWRIPPQYQKYDEANPFPQDCPEASVDGLDAGDIELYDRNPPAESPIELAARSIRPPVPAPLAIKMPAVGV